MAGLSAEHINRNSALALNAMSRYGLVPHPQNYALWFAYYSGRMPMLSAAIDSLLASGKTVTEDRCHDLYTRFLLSPNTECVCRLEQQSSHASIVDALDQIGLPHDKEAEPRNSLMSVFAEGCENLKDDLVFLDTTTLRETRILEDAFGNQNAIVGDEECMELWQHLTTLRSQGEIDLATGMLSPQVFRQVMKETMMLSRRRKSPLSLALLSVDNIDSFSDPNALSTPDIILKMLARTLCERVKAQDAVCRLDRQKFAVLLLNSDLSRAELFANRVRCILADRAIFNRRTQQCLGHLELYIGLAQVRDGEAPERFMRRAAEAIFTAKAKNTPQTIQAF